jgi:hypothetical protein
MSFRKISWLCFLLGLMLAAPAAHAQKNDLNFINHNKPILSAHNCYPYAGKWNDRVPRALNSGFPVQIEQDLAWYVDPATGKGRVVVSHSNKPTGSEPTLHDYFFEQVRPLVEKAITENKREQWPIIVLMFDFKDYRPDIVKAVWQELGEYEPWLSTAVKTDDVKKIMPIERRPIIALAGDADAQAKVFYDDVPVGDKLRIFGAAHEASPPATLSSTDKNHWQATTRPDLLVTDPSNNYRRWTNYSWFPIEEGGQSKAVDWKPANYQRLKAIVDHDHKLGYWVRFYTLDGFAKGGDIGGWGNGYNFGSHNAVITRWKAAIAAGVNFVASDQYEDLATYMKQNSQDLRPLKDKTTK